MMQQQELDIARIEDSLVGTDERKRRRLDASHEFLLVKIVSALYVPSEESEASLTNTATDDTIVPQTRDVTPFLRALLKVQQQRESGTQGDTETNHGVSHEPLPHHSWVRLRAVVGGQRRVQIGVLLLDNDTTSYDSSTTIQNTHDMVNVDKSPVHMIPTPVSRTMGMNGIFGDPAPGLSKRLQIHYMIAQDEPSFPASPSVSSPRRTRPAQAEAHTVSFAEHERVYLRQRCWTNAETLVMGDINVAASTASVSNEVDADPSADHTTSNFDVALPLMTPFLSLRERVQCRLVCSVWRDIIHEYGVAVVVDDADRTLYPHWNTTFLRGVLSHSFASLQRLRLSHTPQLQRSDLHPALPHLRKLQALDITRCVQLDDSTLILLAQCVSSTLEVLYLKGLHQVTDHGLAAIASCRRLQVLDVSYLANITDDSVSHIGQHLVHLRAIYLRDNYHVTHASLNVVTQKCTSLEQLTLWGSIRLQHLSFPSHTKPSLVLLNLWGCHSLRDGCAASLVGMTQLRTLIVSECHQLTDNFVASVTRHVPQLSHLHLRYCKYITDASVHAIAQSMPNLYALDLSFCTKLNVSALVSLIEIRGASLAELRLQACRTLDMAEDPSQCSARTDQRARYPHTGYAGRQLLAALRSHAHGQCSLSVLDVRHCGGHASSLGYRATDPFVEGMTALSFRQKVPGYFVRPAQWNLGIEQRLVDFVLAVEP